MFPHFNIRNWFIRLHQSQEEKRIGSRRHLYHQSHDQTSMRVDEGYMHSGTITRDIHFTLKTKRLTSALTMLSLSQASSTANLDRVTFDSHQLSSSFDPALKLERGVVFFLSTPGFIGSCKNYL